MIIGTMQDYISAKERVPESFMKKAWRMFVRFFDLQNESTQWQIFFVFILGCTILTAFWLAKLIAIGQTFH